MRDGVKLFTAVYVPKDAAKGPDSDSAPAHALLRRPLRRRRPVTGPRWAPSERFQRAGDIVAYQDVLGGRYLSQGTWAEVRAHNPAKGPRDTDESSDTYDTIDWLIKNVRSSNGKVGMWGISDPGLLRLGWHRSTPTPALAAALPPQAPVTDYYLVRRLLPQRRLHARRQLRLLPVLGRTQGRPRASRPQRPVPVQNPRRLRLLPAHGRTGQRRRKILPERPSRLEGKHREHHSTPTGRARGIAPPPPVRSSPLS
jgi:hypothetical protein